MKYVNDGNLMMASGSNDDSSLLLSLLYIL